jgi:hypothetical protein
MSTKMPTWCLAGGEGGVRCGHWCWVSVVLGAVGGSRAERCAQLMLMVVVCVCVGGGGLVVVWLGEETDSPGNISLVCRTILRSGACRRLVIVVKEGNS